MQTPGRDGLNRQGRRDPISRRSATGSGVNVAGEGIPPQTYEALIRVVRDRYDGMSPTFQKISQYLTQHPNDAAVIPVRAASEESGVNASSFVRYAQSLGYTGFKDLQVVFRRRLVGAGSAFGARAGSHENQTAGREGDGNASVLRNLVVREISSLEALLTEIAEEDISAAVGMMEHAQTIYLIGQPRSAPIAEFLHYVLTLLGKKTVILDPSGGLASHAAKWIQPEDLLLVDTFRLDASEAVGVVADTAARGVPVVAISDSPLLPIAKNAKVLLVVPGREHRFSRSWAAPICLARVLATALADRMQVQSDAVMSR